MVKKVWNHESEAAMECCAQVIDASANKSHCNTVDLKYSVACSGQAKKKSVVW